MISEIFQSYSLFSGMVKLLAASSFVCILMVLLGSNRGFDISDEGLYVLLADPHQENVAGIFNYDLFFKLVFNVTGHSFSLIELRMLRLLSYFMGALALAGFWKNIKNDFRLNLDILLISFLGLMCGFAFLPPTLSYNSLSVVLICFWLHLISLPKISLWSSILLGAVLSVLVYIKITAALIFFPATILILIFRNRVPLSHLAFLILPLILSECIFYFSIGENAIIRLAAGIPLNSQRPGYQIGIMIKSVAVGVLWTGLSALMFFTLGYLKRLGNRFFILGLLTAVVAVSSIAYITHITEEWNHLLLLGSSCFFAYCFGQNFSLLQQNRFWLGILILLPFILHFGSNVYWLRIGIHYWVSWLLAFLLYFDNLKVQVGLLVSAVSMLLVFNGIWWHPFGQEKPLWAEKTPWNRNESEVIQLDTDLVAVLANMKVADIHEFSRPLLAAYRIPGLIWLSGGQTSFSPGIWDPSQLPNFFESKPERMIYNKLYPLPSDWKFPHSRDLGIYQGDSLVVLWD